MEAALKQRCVESGKNLDLLGILYFAAIGHMSIARLSYLGGVRSDCQAHKINITRKRTQLNMAISFRLAGRACINMKKTGLVDTIRQLVLPKDYR